MKVTVKEGWSEKSKMAIAAIAVGVIAIIAAVMLD
jgi:hypothetical protein